MRTLARLFGVLLLLAAMTTGCSSMAKVDPYRNAQDVVACQEEEARLLAQAKEFDETIANGGFLYRDEELEAYLSSILEELYPEFPGQFEVHLLKSPVLNAFILPNGSVYVHLGLLASLDSEAQIASVLAHEGVHFTHRHALCQNRHFHLSAGFAQALSLAGIPLLGPILAVSSISGYSRDMEREADAEGFKRLQAAGYAPGESVKAFEHLSREAALSEEESPFFFASHPALQERIEHFQELVGENGQSGKTGEEVFQNQTQTLRVICLEENLSRRRYAQVIETLEDQERFRRYPPFAGYYLGEAYRQRGEEKDSDRAEKAYRDAVTAAPDFAPAHRALGIIKMKNGEKVEAKAYLEDYLRLAPQAQDQAYVQSYLNDLAQQEDGERGLR